MAVGFLGQSSQPAWWDCDFLSDPGQQFLAFNFPRNPLLAGFSASCLAAKRVHDERIGRIGAYHLFRLPAEMEAQIHHAVVADNSQLLRDVPLSSNEALDAIAEIAAETLDPPEGPVQVGKLGDCTLKRGIEEMAKHYRSGFQRGLMTLPYFADRRR